MTTRELAQAKADHLAATFNRLLRKTNDCPLTVHRVVMLHLTRRILGELKGAPDLLACENIPAVEQSLAAIEQECREAGLFEQFAEMRSDDRAALMKLTEAEND